MQEKFKSLLIYAGKCVTGTLLIFLLASWFHYKDLGWPLISVLLVLSPDGKDAVTLAVARIKANLVGATVGLLCLLIAPPGMWTLCMGIVIVLALCFLFKLETGARSALAATVIILLHEEGKHVWNTALERVIAVLAGCILALAVTFIFHFNIGKTAKDKNEAS